MERMLGVKASMASTALLATVPFAAVTVTLTSTKEVCKPRDSALVVVASASTDGNRDLLPELGTSTAAT